MTALVVPLDRVRRAVDQSARLGMPEAQAAVVARIVADVRDEQSVDWQQRYDRAMRLIGVTLLSLTPETERAS